MEAKMRRLFLATSAFAMLAALPVMGQNSMGAAPSSDTATGAPVTQQDRQQRQTMGSSSSQSTQDSSMRSGIGSGSSSDTKNSDHAMSKHAARHANTKSSEVSETAQLNRDEANSLQRGNH
jgi:hypothetical protein